MRHHSNKSHLELYQILRLFDQILKFQDCMHLADQTMVNAAFRTKFHYATVCGTKGMQFHMTYVSFACICTNSVEYWCDFLIWGWGGEIIQGWVRICQKTKSESYLQLMIVWHIYLNWATNRFYCLPSVLSVDFLFLGYQSSIRKVCQIHGSNKMRQNNNCRKSDNSQNLCAIPHIVASLILTDIERFIHDFSDF